MRQDRIIHLSNLALDMADKVRPLLATNHRTGMTPDDVALAISLAVTPMNHTFSDDLLDGIQITHDFLCDVRSHLAEAAELLRHHDIGGEALSDHGSFTRGYKASITRAARAKVGGPGSRSC